MNRTNRSLQAGQFTVHIDDDSGKLGDLHCPDGKVVPSVGGTAEVRFGTMRWVLSQPARITASGDAAIAEYEISSNPKIYVQIKYQLHPEGKTVALVREVSVRADERLKEDLTVSLPNWPAKLPAEAWLPLPDGTQGKLGAKPAGYDFQGPLGQEHAAIQLPMVTYQMADARRVTIATDPYSTRAMMRLVREVARKVERHNPQMALLASDCYGLCGSANYAVVAHGTYQDAWCEPKTWAAGIYPNWRNTLWSCCWWPVSKWKWVEFGVKNYQAPVSISNGWGDNTGFAKMAPDMQKKVLELFRWRAQFRSQMKLMEIPPVFK